MLSLSPRFQKPMKLYYLELTRLVRDCMAVRSVQRHGAVLLTWTAALPLDPGAVVRVHLVANAVRRADGQVFFAVLEKARKVGTMFSCCYESCMCKAD